MIKQEERRVEPILRAEKLTKRFGELTANREIDIEIHAGEIHAIAGENGAGKSTLMKMLYGVYQPTAGNLYIDGEKMERWNPTIAREKGIGMVFQDFRLLKDRTIFENVAFAQQVVEVPHRYIKRQVENMLEMVGLKDRMNAFPNELSGGEQQRVAIARALVNHPVLLLADEPTGNLDPVTAKGIMELLSEINKSGTTVLVVTHNKELVNEMGKRVILIEDGHIEQDEIRGSYDI